MRANIINQMRKRENRNERGLFQTSNSIQAQRKLCKSQVLSLSIHISFHLMHLFSFVCFMEFILVYCKHLPTVSGTSFSSGLAADIKGI